jgi:polygalacturonase
MTIQNSAFWPLHPYASSNVHIHDIVILGPGYAPNTDSIDIDSCRDVLIKHCEFHVGDDGTAIKSGLNEAGRNFNTPSENIVIRNCTVSPQLDNLSTIGVSIGSELSGGVRNVTIEDVVISK